MALLSGLIKIFFDDIFFFYEKMLTIWRKKSTGHWKTFWPRGAIGVMPGPWSNRFVWNSCSTYSLRTHRRGLGVFRPHSHHVVNVWQTAGRPRPSSGSAIETKNHSSSYIINYKWWANNTQLCNRVGQTVFFHRDVLNWKCSALQTSYSPVRSNIESRHLWQSVPFTF